MLTYCKNIILCFLLVICSISLCFSQPIQRIEITSSLNPVGSGARAIGMGGAFIAVADDATAASWNPGGLIQLELPEISFVEDIFHRIENNNFGANPEASGSQHLKKYDINYLSVVYPFHFLRYNMITSLSYQYLYDFTRKWDFSITQVSDNELSVNHNILYEQDGGLSALGLAYSIEVTPQFSFELTLNIWDDDICPNRWEKKSYQSGLGVSNGHPFSFESFSFERYSLRGINVNLGILWSYRDKLKIGAVLKTPFEADLNHQLDSNSSLHYQNPEDKKGDVIDSIALTMDEKLNMPVSYGVGIAYRSCDRFTLSLDIFRTEWDDFIITDSHGNQISPISGLSINDSDISGTYQVRIGSEYLIINPKYIIPIRCGIFYDPTPSEGSSDDYYGFSLGSGIKVGRFDFDLAYQYRYGNNVGTSIFQNLNFSQDVYEHTFYISMIYHFGKRYEKS